MGRGVDESGLDLRTEAPGIPDLIDPSRFDDVGKEVLRAVVFRILPVEVAAALLELPAELRQNGVFHTIDGTRPVKSFAHVGREFSDSLLQNPVESLRLLQIIVFHSHRFSFVCSASPPTYFSTKAFTRRVYSSRLSR